MCGICGVITQKLVSDSDIHAVFKMNASLIHRGPDDEGVFSDDHVILAMRRLSIIDLAGGRQPLYNEDGTLILIINGEIYNFLELRKILEEKGHTFSTKSDCETILHLYEEYGSACVNHLRGMFAFALWDQKQQLLMLARDRMGEKPLYFYQSGEKILFSSELKSLLQSAEIPFILDPDSINLFFYYQYVPEPRTPIKNVRKLPPGHFFTIDLTSFRCTQSCYWRMEDSPPLTGNPSELIRCVLDEIGNLTVRSDVPVGVALSGGLDSSAIAALAVKNYPDTMHAFSIGYPGHPPCDERQDAEKFADFLGMPFHDIELKTETLVSAMPDLVYFRDDPIADISGYGYYSVMKLAHDHHVPVMLQGQGGDELFFGYRWVQESVKQSLRKEYSLKNGGNHFWMNYFNPTISGLTSPSEVLQWMRGYGGLRTAWTQYHRDRSMPKDQLVFMDLIPDFNIANLCREKMYTVSFNDMITKNLPNSFFTSPQPWNNAAILMTRLICQTYLLENGIAQADRLSMASSVELRLPLVDYRLVETVIGLRKTYSDYNLTPKAWFKSAIKDIVPEWVVNRPKKGFTPPVKEWHTALFQRYGSMLNEGLLVDCGVFKSETAKKMAKGPYPRGTFTPLSFKALVLEIWCRKMTELINNIDKNGT
jgi:asparagine synthase (glutamine-hydrolysing)